MLRDYSAEGERLTLPGLARTFTPRAHQRAAVARIIAEPAVGLFHQVGAGKTAEMVMGAMELRRLSLVAKPAVVVPNHMLEQFAREWLQLYPQARVLAASSDDLAGDRRRAFVARAAANEWDGVILTRSAFQRLGVTSDTEQEYERAQLVSLRAMLEKSKGERGLTVKRIEKQVARIEEQLKGLLDTPRDPGVCFEQTGIDYLLVDEGHDYKNLRTISNIRDAAIDGSQRASDLHMKLHWLRGRHGGRVATLATATPIANSVTEAHVMTRYLRPDLLEQAGIEDFDAWAATFGQTVTEIEVAPTGGGDYRMHTRFAKFQNVPEMLRIWHVFADVKTAEDLRLPVPELAERPDGQRAPATVLIDPSPELRAYVEHLAARADRVRARAVSPEEDNMLLVTTDGRKAALDMRLVAGEPASVPGKLEHAADTIAGVWAKHRARTYTDPASGERSPIPGALQIVFCDLSTPSRERWNAYDELRALLGARGLPPASVRFIHEARNDAEKARLFAACRAGHVAVLVGSTEKMGVGTNIQDRCVAVHHLDCPWRPSDLEQRDGRGVRQGNQNPEIAVYRYATQGSFDTYSWQTVERKARFIAQVMRGRLDSREIEDIGENALSFAEVKALASGDPLILEKARADAEATRLVRLERAWQRSHHTLRHTIAGAEDRAGALDTQLRAVAAALERRRDTRGERFTMTVAGRRLTARADAAQALAAHLGRIPYGQRVPFGELGGLPIDAEIRADHHGHAIAELTLHGLPAAPASVERARLGDGGLSLVRQLEHRVEHLPELAQRLREQQRQALGEAAGGRDQLARPFKYARELAAARHEQQRIDHTLAERHREHNAQPDLDVDVTLDEPVPAQAPAPAANTAPPAPRTAAERPGTEPGTLEPDTAESLRLLRATQAAPITDALRSPPAPGPAARPSGRSPSRSPRPRR